MQNVTLALLYLKTKVMLFHARVPPAIERKLVVVDRIWGWFASWYQMSPSKNVNYKHDALVVVISICGASAFFMLIGLQMSLMFKN